MKQSMKLKLLTVLFALSFCVQGGLCGTPERPGSSVKTKQLPATIRRFLSRQFVGRQFTYRQDRNFYYAFIDEWQYVLFSRDGAVRGFRFRTMQPMREVASCIPCGVSSYIGEHYPGYYTNVFLPVADGFRVELYGTAGADTALRRRGTFANGGIDAATDGIKNKRYRETKI